MNSRAGALIAAFLATLIYGVSYTIAKDVMPIYVKPFGFILMRVLGATVLFWIISIFTIKERIQPNDFFRIALASVFGIAINMLAFYKGLSLTTPISASIIMVTSPILVLILSTIILKEKVTLVKVLGIFIGLTGAVILIRYGQNVVNGDNVIKGNLLVFLNATSYSLYLIIVKRLTDKYHPFTLIKWLYLMGLIWVLPFGYSEATDIQWHQIPLNIYYKIGFIVVFTTFLTYLFNLFALTKIKPTTLSVFIYLQPVIATIYALFTKSDSLNTIKILATILIFIGVYIVTRKRIPKKIKST